MSQLSPEQLAQVETWAAAGAGLGEVQERLKTDFGINLTYLDARLLMLDVGVRLKDKPREVEKAPEPAPAPPEEDVGAEGFEEEDPDAGTAAETEAGVDETAVPLEMTTDQIALPGTVISGKVTFSDGVTGAWFLDQMGRLGLSGTPQGYQPPKADIPQFQRNLDAFLQRAGY